MEPGRDCQPTINSPPGEHGIYPITPPNPRKVWPDPNNAICRESNNQKSREQPQKQRLHNDLHKQQGPFKKIMHRKSA